MNLEQSKEHKWLERFAGEWTWEMEAAMEPGKSPVKHTGTESVRSLGGFWIIAEGHGEMPEGGPATTMMTLGFDPQKKRFVGTFVGSMMTNMWVYEGELDASGNVLTLNTEGPSMSAEGKIAKYQDIIEVRSDDHRIMTSQALGEDGKWQRVMSADYRRKK
jgi:hypothetical protein